MKKFAIEVLKIFSDDSNKTFSIKEIEPDLTQNSYSLRRSVYSPT